MFYIDASLTTRNDRNYFLGKNERRLGIEFVDYVNFLNIIFTSDIALCIIEVLIENDYQFHLCGIL